MSVGKGWGLKGCFHPFFSAYLQLLVFLHTFWLSFLFLLHFHGGLWGQANAPRSQGESCRESGAVSLPQMPGLFPRLWKWGN